MLEAASILHYIKTYIKHMNQFDLVLLVDDDAATNEYHSIIVTKSGVARRVHMVTSGQAGLDFLQSKVDGAHPRPNLILLDINMPAMNGFEFMEHYDKLPEEQKGQMVIIMVTTSLNPDDRKRAESISHIKGFQNKPLSVPDLLKLATDFGT